MNMVLAKNGQGEQPARVAVPATQKGTSSQLGLECEGSPSLTDRVMGTPGSEHSFALLAMCLGMNDLLAIPIIAPGTNPIAVPVTLVPTQVSNVNLLLVASVLLVPPVGVISQFPPRSTFAPQYVNATTNSVPPYGYAPYQYYVYPPIRPKQYRARPTDFWNGYQHHGKFIRTEISTVKHLLKARSLNFQNLMVTILRLGLERPKNLLSCQKLYPSKGSQ